MVDQLIHWSRRKCGLSLEGEEQPPIKCRLVSTTDNTNNLEPTRDSKGHEQVLNEVVEEIPLPKFDPPLIDPLHPLIFRVNEHFFQPFSFLTKPLIMYSVGDSLS